jgi:hypothetical protein
VNRNHPENGIIDLMRRDGRPIFILEDAASMEQLEDLLRPVLGGNFPPQEMSRFQGILREFEHMLTLFPECQIH